MAPAKTPKEPPGKDWKPPRGIRYSYRPDRPNAPFYLHWRSPEGGRKKAAYPSATARQKAAKNLAEKKQSHGKAVLEFDPAEWQAWQHFKDLIAGADLAAVAAHWLKTGGKDGADGLTRVADTIARYLVARKAEGVGKASLSHTKKDLERFAVAFPGNLADVTSDKLRAWIVALPFKDSTKRNHYKNGAALFNFAKREKLISDNPFNAVERPKDSEEEVSVLSADDAAKLFAAAALHRPDTLPRLALEAFAGLRFSTASQIDRAKILFDEDGIRIPAAKMKTRRTHFIDELPGNLWVFLRAAPDESWQLRGKDYERAKSDVFRLAGVINPGNVLRHSFCSYHVAIHKDAARTAVILCHKSPSMLYQHYRGKATAVDAARYFATVPAWFPSSP